MIPSTAVIVTDTSAAPTTTIPATSTTTTTVPSTTPYVIALANAQAAGWDLNDWKCGGQLSPVDEIAAWVAANPNACADGAADPFARDA